MADPPPEALRLFLDRLLLRSPLSEEEQAAILALPTRQQEVAPGEDLVVPGEETVCSCLVAAGLMSRFDTMRDGRRQIVAFYLPGDMCDLHSVAVPTSGWGLEALTRSIVLLIPHDSLRKLVADPNMALAFWRDTTADGSILAKWVGNLGRKQAIPRLAHLFCEMGVRTEKAGLGTRTDFQLPITQAQLADAAGLTPVHLNRTLKALKAEGVTFTGRRVGIADWNRISAMAEFDPAYLLLPTHEGAENRQ
jgi:CRP-like cAMP-binding protein